MVFESEKRYLTSLANGKSKSRFGMFMSMARMVKTGGLGTKENVFDVDIQKKRIPGIGGVDDSTWMAFLPLNDRSFAPALQGTDPLAP